MMYGMKLGIWSKTNATFPKNEKEWMIWTLDIMVRAADARSDYYRFQEMQLGPPESYDPSSFPHRDLLRLIGIDQVFTLLRSIEAFFGVLSVCWKISTGSRDVKTAKGLHRRLLRPGTNTLKVVKNKLRQGNIDKETLCQLCGFPIPEKLGIDRKSQIALWEVYDQTLKRVKLYGRYALRYERLFRDLRNAFSHNMRILYLEIAEANETEPEKADVVGTMNPSTCRPDNLILFCQTQREAMSELTLRLCQVEKILYDNLKFYVWNDCVPVPPVAAVFVPERFQDTLIQIKRDLPFDWNIPAFRVEIRDSKSGEKQYNLHRRFLGKLQKLGSRR